ncbi:MAG: tetratricopeptide repeat protein [Hyphomicrobium sp.]|jgi:localization factor PodJL
MSNELHNEHYGSRREGASMGANEPSTTSMLDQMRDRLTSLSDEAKSIRSQVPYEFGPDVERIQQQMHRLGERLSDLSRGALVPYAGVQHVQERRIKEVRYVTQDDVRVGRAQPDEIISLGGPAGGRRSGANLDAPWDDAAASALMELYESGEVYMAARADSTKAANPRNGVGAVAYRAVQNPVYACGSMAMDAASMRAPQGCSMDKSALDQRFAEIAARIEQSLSQIHPEAALTSLGNRFDQLEAQINTMLGQMATRADLEEVRVAESQIEEIASQLIHFRSQMQRLDMIDAHLGTLTSHLSDERLTRLFNEGVHLNADVGRLDAIDAQLRMIAVQLSDERLSGLVSRSSSRGDDYEDVAHAAAQRAVASFTGTQNREDPSRDIGEVRGMLENLINERRHNDENNASMLETMQQAIIRVLDRIDAIEFAQPQAPASTPRTSLAASLANASAAPAAPAATLPDYDDLVPATATIFAEMRRVEVDASDFLPVESNADVDSDMNAYRQDTADEHAPPRIPAYATASFDLDEAFSNSRDTEASSFAEPQPAARPIEDLRHDFIADAHRAKLKAASKPDASVNSDLRAGELSVGGREMPAKARSRRSIFSFRSQRVAMSLLVLLAAIPAAIFFMPRTTTASVDSIAAPAAATVRPAVRPDGALPHDAMDAAPVVPAVPNEVPRMSQPPSKQTKQDVPAFEQRGSGEYEDANVSGASIDTASLPDGITMQGGSTTGEQLARMNEQARMAHISGQLGIAAAKATPVSLMEEQLVRGSAQGDGTTSAVAKLPPATVGPYSLRIAAAQGDVSAQFEVASRLAEGKGTDQDLAEAAQWYQRAAANGFAMAQFRLGTLYERGLGVKADPRRALVWYERAAKQGNVKAMHNLAVLAASISPKGDYKTAARWFEDAAAYGLADSQYNLAVLYENGMGVGKDLQQAYKWLILAAKSGDKDAAGRRNALKAKLNADELAAAEMDAETWSARPIAGMANDGRYAGQAWRDSNRRG